MTRRVPSRLLASCMLATGVLGFSFVAHAAPVYLECQTADDKGKKQKAMTFALDEATQTVTGALGAMDGAYAGPSPDTDKNLSALSGLLGGKPQSSGANLRTPQSRKATFSAEHVEFSLLQPSGGESTAVSFNISRIDLSITEKYPLMKARKGTCKVVEPPKRAF